MPSETACLHFEFISTPPLLNDATIVGFIPLTSDCMPSGEGKLEMAHETHPAVTSTLHFMNDWIFPCTWQYEGVLLRFQCAIW